MFSGRLRGWMIPARVIALLVAVADQALKQIALRSLTLGETLPVLPGFFNLTLVRNPGAVWGFFAGRGELLILLSFVSIGVLVLLHKKSAKNLRLHAVSIGLMAGGILGNLCDRLAYGYVVDFLDFHVRAWHWPAFNPADSAICLGIALYLIASRHAAAVPASSTMASDANGTRKP